MQRIGEILLEKGVISEAEIEEALEIQDEKGGRIGEILIARKHLSEADLYPALAEQFGLPFLERLPEEEIDPALVSRLPISFAKTYKVLPISRDNGTIRVVAADPLELGPIDDIGILLDGAPLPVVSTPQRIEDAINFVYDKAAEEQRRKEMIDGIDEDVDIGHALDHIEESEDILDSDEDAPIIRFVNTILVQAVKERASDIHIEPFERKVSVRFRIDGILYEVISPPKKFHSSIVARIKVMAKLNIAEKRLPQDGRIKIKIAGKEVDIRTSVIPNAFGERVVMRLLDKSAVLLDLEDIGMTGPRLQTIESLIHKSHGILLVTGPTGSGKTTTLYAMLSRINSPDKNILTAEDPIEYQINGIGQMQVNPKIDLTFANALRSFLRQDPDVIMVGEIRDYETAEIAIQASLTGHLVFSTLHTNDAASAVTRLIEMGVEPFLVSSSVIGIMAQRLVRVVCPCCRVPYRPSDVLLEELQLERAQLPDGVLYKQGEGCERCKNKTGYAGRTGIFELMTMNDAIRGLVMKHADASSLKKAAIDDGMITLREDGVRKVLAGITTVEEIFRVTQDDAF